MLPDSFWAKVDKHGPTPIARPDLGPCWVWTARIQPNGYGKWMAPHSWAQRSRYPHLVTYADAVGPIPKGLELDHLCRVRACCNPSHLEPVTHAVNRARGLNGMTLRTHCPSGHAYDEANTYLARTAKGLARHCRACHRARGRRAG